MKKSIYSKQYKKFLELVIEARKEAKVTQQELARRLGKPQSFVSKYESGERRLDVVEFMTILKMLKKNPEDIIKNLR